jgi:hypothetical protein
MLKPLKTYLFYLLYVRKNVILSFFYFFVFNLNNPPINLFSLKKRIGKKVIEIVFLMFFRVNKMPVEETLLQKLA